MNFDPTHSEQKEHTIIPHPIAPFSTRILSFLLDVILVIALLVTVLGKFVLPAKYPQEMHKMEMIISQYAAEIEQQAAQNEKTPALPEFPDEIQEMMHFIQTFTLVFVWLYFALSEILLQGSSLGKKIFRLRVLSTRTGEPISLLESIIRGGFKAMTLLSFFPLLTASYIIFFFNKNRLAGHDYLCRSIVVEDLVLSLDNIDQPATN